MWYNQIAGTNNEVSVSGSKWAALILLCFTYISYLYLQIGYRPQCTETLDLPTSDTINLVTRLYNAQRLLHRAHRSEHLGKMKILLMKTMEFLNPYNETIGNVVQRAAPGTVSFGPETCPEYWGNPMEDRIYFENVYRTEPCDRIPLEKLVELLIYTSTCDEGNRLIDRVHIVYPKLVVHLAVLSNTTCGTMKTNVHYYPKLKDNADMWVKLATSAMTKYVLVGRNMVEFTHYTDIDRMLRAMNNLSVDVVGGAVRLEPEGRWYFGCYQATVRNFTIRIHPGYDFAARSCALCDYIASPFLIKRRLFLQRMRKSSMTGIIPFVEFFLNADQTGNEMNLRTLLCVDVLFHVQGHESPRGFGVSETPKSSWLDLAKKWTIDRILLPGNVDYRYQCNEVNIRCELFQRPGLLLPGCCMRSLVKCINRFFRLASSFNYTAYLSSGSTLGAVKTYGGVLPWDSVVDISLDVYQQNLTVGSFSLKSENRYGCDLDRSRSFGPKATTCTSGVDTFCSFQQSIRKNFESRSDNTSPRVSDIHGSLKSSTMVNLNGIWALTSIANPGQELSRLYEGDILEHVGHWQEPEWGYFWPINSFNRPKDFPRCPSDVIQRACLDRNYLTQGNIQFQDFVL